MNDQKNDQPKNVIDVDPVTLLFLTIAVLLIPLLVAGFWN